MTGRYVKKPVEVEAMWWDGSDPTPILEWIRANGGDVSFISVDWILLIETLEGRMTAKPDDWIIRGVNGEFYPVKPEIFAKTYDKVG